jgi:hypothetical protein
LFAVFLLQKIAQHGPRRLNDRNTGNQERRAISCGRCPQGLYHIFLRNALKFRARLNRSGMKVCEIGEGIPSNRNCSAQKAGSLKIIYKLFTDLIKSWSEY